MSFITLVELDDLQVSRSHHCLHRMDDEQTTHPTLPQSNCHKQTHPYPTVVAGLCQQQQCNYYSSRFLSKKLQKNVATTTKQTKMSSVQLGLDLIATFLLAAGLLFHYGNWYRHHIFVTLAVLIAWYFSFIIVLVLPIDISTTTYLQCLSQYNETTTNSTYCPHPPSSYVGTLPLTNLWRVVYWSSQCLTWSVVVLISITGLEWIFLLLSRLLLPLTQSYINTGEFTIKAKLKASLLDNAIYYSLYLFICVVLLIYLATRPDMHLDFQKLKAIASSASNSWGLFLLVFMLGYGLTSVPLTLYTSSKPGFSLKSAYFRTAKLSQERNSAEETLDDVLESLQAVLNTNQSLKYRNHLNEIDKLIPLEFKERLQRRRNRLSSEPLDSVDEKALVKLHRQVKRSLQTYHRTECQWARHIDHVVFLEDVEKNSRANGGVFVHSFDSGKSPVWKLLGGRMEYIYRCLLYRHILKTLALLSGTFSLAIIWSEVLFFNKTPVLSLFAVFLNSAKYDFVAIEIVSTLTIAYLSICAFYSVFKIRVFNYYYLAGGHQTDEVSLVFSGMLLSRLTPPLCLNVISLFHLDSHIIKTQSEETAYTKIMGHMDVLSLISNGFNIYFPMGILIVALMTWFKVGARLLSWVGFEQFLEKDTDTPAGEDQGTADLVSEGVLLVGREKRRRLRIAEQAQPRDRERSRNMAADTAATTLPATVNLRNSSNPPRDLFDDV